MLKAQVFSAKGIKAGEISLPSFNQEKPNMVLLSQAMRVYEDRTHPGLSKVQTRAEVNRTKKKVYRQKGTGGARHGARSAPIYVGGGVAHGPKGVKRRLILPAKIIRQALRSAMSLKGKSGELFVISGVKTIKKTKDVKALLEKIGKSLGKDVKRATFVLSPENKEVKRAMANIKGVNAVSIFNVNAYSVYTGGIILVDKDGLEAKRPQKIEEKEEVAETKKTVKKVAKSQTSKKTKPAASPRKVAKKLK